MAEFDAKLVLRHTEKFITAGKDFSLPPALLAAIASRESRGGSQLKNGFGDHNQGFGLMQVDKRFHQLEGTDDPASLAHIRQATGILESFRKAVSERHPEFPPERRLQGAVAAYNAGTKVVQTLNGMDIGTTGNDYSNDVWARARFYAEKMGSVVPATPSTTIGDLKALNNISTPAPTLAEVEAGTSKLQQGMVGDAVKSLQDMLMTLGYLVLTEEQKAQGAGQFGPRTDTALQSFQRDVYLPPAGVLEVVTFHALRQILDAAVKKDADNQVGIVRRLQDRLVDLKKMTRDDIGSAYGTFGPKTEAALTDFQNQQNIAGGLLTVETYLALRIASLNPPPVIDVGSGDDTKVESQLPSAGPGFFAKGGATSRDKQFCTERTLNRLMAFAAVWMQKHPDRPLRIGEMSQQGGGKFGKHKGEGHLRGFAIDIGLFRKDGANEGTNFHDKQNFDAKLTGELIAALDETPNAFKMIFNDPEFTAKNLRRDGAGIRIHDDHVHVEFQERSQP
jgi:peptidoglycan hydrolase-like protein with peptidoglycan-binding domain